MKGVKSCPFCGGELQTLGENHYYAHPTNGCILQHLCFEVDDKQAIEAWNRREPIDRAVKRLEDVAKHRRNTCKQINGTERFRMNGYVNGLEKAAEIVKGYTE